MSWSNIKIHSIWALIFFLGPDIPFVAVYKTQRDTESETQDRESEYFNQAAGLHVKKYISSSGWLQKQVIALASHVKMSKFTKLKS